MDSTSDKKIIKACSSNTSRPYFVVLVPSIKKILCKYLCSRSQVSLLPFCNSSTVFLRDLSGLSCIRLINKKENFQKSVVEDGSFDILRRSLNKKQKYYQRSFPNFFLSTDVLQIAQHISWLFFSLQPTLEKVRNGQTFRKVITMWHQLFPWTWLLLLAGGVSLPLFSVKNRFTKTPEVWFVQLMT